MNKTSSRPKTRAYTCASGTAYPTPVHAALTLVYWSGLSEPVLAISSRLLPWQALSYQTRAARQRTLPAQLPDLTLAELDLLQAAELQLLRKRQTIFLRVQALAALQVAEVLPVAQRSDFLVLLDRHTRPSAQDYWQSYHSDLRKQLEQLGGAELAAKLRDNSKLAAQCSKYAKAMLPEVPDFMLSPVC